MTTSTIGKDIVAFRARHKLDQSGFAKGCGYSKKHIQHIEKERRQPSASALKKIQQFMQEATPEILAALRGPGSGNSSSPVRRGRKLRPRELDAVELRRLAPEELDDELDRPLKKF